MRLSTSALFALLVLVLMGCQPIESNEASEKEQISGAYEALQFFGKRTTYPEVEIPQAAFYRAWQQNDQLRQVEAQARGGTMPWESMGPVNRGGRTLALAFNPLNPNTLWIGTASGGLWRSYTEGLGAEAWHYIETGFPVLGVSTIALPPGDSTTLYIGTGEVYNYEAAGTGAAYRSTRGSYGMGILKSTDGGETWALSLDWSYDQNRGIWAIKIDPDNPNTVYAATTHGVYKSTDAGDSWVEKLDVPMANDLVIHPENTDIIVAGVGNLGSPNRGIYRSTDGGETWVEITTNIPQDFQGKIQLNYAPSDPDILYASIGNGFGFSDGATWLCRSTNFGATWTVVNEEDYSRWQGWFAHDVDVSLDDPDEIVAVGITAWRSTDGGQFLIEEAGGGIGDVNPDPGDNSPREQVHSDCHDVQWHPTNPNIVYVTSDGGVHRSTDRGQTYQFVNGGLQNCQFYNGFSNSLQNPNFCLGGLQDNGTISWNGDNTWTVISGGDGSWSAINPEHDTTFYVSSQRLNVRRNRPTDGWTGMNIPEVSEPVFIAPYAICPSDGDIMYAGNGGIVKTVNGGDNWDLTIGGSLLDGGNPVLSLDVSSNPDVVYCGTAPTTLFGGSRSGFFVTQDGGTTFQDRTGILPDRYPMDVEVDPTDEATAYVVFSGFGSGHVYKTTDYGVNWTDITGELPDIPTNAIVVDPDIPDHIYVGNDFGVYVSRDGGESWESYQEGLNTATMIFDLVISPANRKLRAATHGNGAYQRDLLDFDVSTDELSEQLNGLKLYPNPATTATTIEFELQEAQELQLRLVNVAGKVVQERAATNYPAGQHRISWSCEGLSAGTYFLQLQATTGLRTQKLVILDK